MTRWPRLVGKSSGSAAGLAALINEAYVRPSVNRHDAHIVNHLDHQDDVARCLKHLHVVVVSRGEQWRPRGEPNDASLGETPVLRTVRADPARTM